jgi:fatty-acyl-CoA synthase
MFEQRDCDRSFHPATAACFRPDLRLRDLARTQPDRIALIFRGESLSYRLLWERVETLAAGLVRRGASAGDRIACICGNHPAFVELYFACSMIGSIFVPLNARLAPPELLFQLEDTRPILLFLGPGLAGLEAGLRSCGWNGEAAVFCLDRGPAGRTHSYESLFGHGVLPEEKGCLRPSSPEDPQMILFTSGTAGLPKGALLPYRKTLYNSLNAEGFFELTGEDRVLVPVPLFHSLGLNILTVPVLLTGGTVILQERFDEETTLRLAEEWKVTFLGAVPTIYQRLLRVGLDKRDLSSLKFCFTAGAPIAVPVIEAYHRRGLLLKQGYGQTETSILCCLDARDTLRKAGSVGKPVRYGKVRVVDEQGRDVEPGRVGEIVAQGPIVMLGYWNRPEETARVLRAGWLHTQDLATVDEEGFVTLVGRKGDLYISGGENIHPEEIERLYRTHPCIQDIAVIGVPNPDLGETGLAFVVAEPGASLSEAELRAFAEGRIGRYKIPRTFVFVDALPRTVTGKVQKYLLRQKANEELGEKNSAVLRDQPGGRNGKIP